MIVDSAKTTFARTPPFLVLDQIRDIQIRNLAMLDLAGGGGKGGALSVLLPLSLAAEKSLAGVILV